MSILALNCGSSSLKFAVFEEDARDRGGVRRVAAGGVDRIASAPALRAGREGGAVTESPVTTPGHKAAADAVLEWLEANGLRQGVGLVGHRVVHGGAHFREPVVVDQHVLTAIEEAGALAVLHNGPALAVLRSTMASLGNARHVAVFDTAFHRSMPPRAARYAIPGDLAERHGIERFGFHGLAHRCMLEAVATAEGREPASLRLVTLQLGSGCSAAAIEGGRSIDTTMGLTPLEGLMMATRSGDVDPALPGILARAEGASAGQVEEWLNQRSGLLGVSGRSADMRDLLAAEEQGDERSALAVEMFCYRVRKQVGAYLAALGGADAVVFGGGIGEHQPEVRRRICEPLAALGIHLDAAANEQDAPSVRRITTAASPIAAYIASVDEEQMVAREAAAISR